MSFGAIDYSLVNPGNNAILSGRHKNMIFPLLRALKKSVLSQSISIQNKNCWLDLQTNGNFNIIYDQSLRSYDTIG
ncbi:hypothetical protein HUJ05_002684 [Dendroctonus ponderosae]|nr:hypothetical protein HUJ05_002684 [Dendroctonus ponderosae]